MIPASHPIPEPEARKPLSRWEFAILMLEQLGRCKVCGARLEKGKTRDEHVQALHLGGSNDLSNRELWCLDCTKPKDDVDKALIAKGKRIRGETCAGPKRAIPSRSAREEPGEKTRWRGSRAKKPDDYVSPLSKKARREAIERMEARRT